MKVLVAIADGSEEVEALTSANVLARGGCHVTVASVTSSLEVTGARKLPLKAMVLLRDVAKQHYDMIVLPGGMPGAKNLRESSLLCDMLKRQKERGWIAAICAAPAVVLNDLKLLGTKSTCYPGFDLQDTENTQAPYEVSDKVVTGRGPGTAMAFALKCVEVLVGKEKAEEVMRGLLLETY